MLRCEAGWGAVGEDDVIEGKGRGMLGMLVMGEERRTSAEDLGASHRQRTDFTRHRRYPIVTANAGRSFVTGARDGHSD